LFLPLFLKRKHVSDRTIRAEAHDVIVIFYHGLKAVVKRYIQRTIRSESGVVYLSINHGF
jgi:hypothetical protein